MQINNITMYTVRSHTYPYMINELVQSQTALLNSFMKQTACLDLDLFKEPFIPSLINFIFLM